MEENDAAATHPTSNSSLASSSLKTPVSAPIKSNLDTIPSGHSLGHRSYESDYEQRTHFANPDRSGSYEAGSRGGGGQKRHKAMKTLQQELERRSLLRPHTSQRIRIEPKPKEEEKKLPFKALTDLLFQTAVLGIDTTAKLTKPTLSHIVFPLFRDLWTEYAPSRLQAWVKIVPTSIANVGNLLWDTPAGLKLGRDLRELKDDAMDVASSEVSRQCWIDFTVGIIKFVEALHTPEVKEALDQMAVSVCRFIDVWSSGKAKQVWFDLSCTVWSLVEVASDPLVVMTLAEVCAQACFALEEERASLKRRRVRSDAARRRKERDERQMDMYPPAREAVRGREGVEKALMQTLTHKLGEESEADVGNDNGPPSVIVQNNPIDDAGEKKSPALDPIYSTDQDGESEITTEEIEDLRLQEETNGDDHWMPLESREQQLVYEKGDDESCPDLASETNHHEADAPETYDFQESILQFHRRLNEVLEKSRKESNLRDVVKHMPSKEKKLQKEIAVDANTDRNVTNVGNKTAPFSNFIKTLHKNQWKIIVSVMLCGIATIFLLWFLLGCYGFYVILFGGGISHTNSLTTSTSKINAIQQTPVIIQVMVGHPTGDEHDKSDGFASMTLEEWKQMTRDVETAIRRRIDTDAPLEEL